MTTQTNPKRFRVSFKSSTIDGGFFLEVGMIQDVDTLEGMASDNCHFHMAPGREREAVAEAMGWITGVDQALRLAGFVLYEKGQPDGLIGTRAWHELQRRWTGANTDEA